MSYMEWFSLGLLLVLLELFVPGVYLVWFGLSAFVTGALTIYHDFTVIEQSLVFGLISVVFALTGWFFYGRIMKRSKVSDRYKQFERSGRAAYRQNLSAGGRRRRRTFQGTDRRQRVDRRMRRRSEKRRQGQNHRG